METDKLVFDALLADIQREMPDFEIRFKDESRLMRAIGFVLSLFNPKFMTHYTTTVGRKCYFPNRAFLATWPWRTVSHESIHGRDDRDHWYFKVTYLPLLLAPLALAAVGAVWWFPMIFALAFLVTLIPFPAPGRRHWERRAYLMSICCDVITNGADYVRQIPYVVYMSDMYCTGAYYWMSWSRSATEQRVRDDVEYAIRIAQGSMTLQPYSSMVKLIQEKRKVS